MSFKSDYTAVITGTGSYLPEKVLTNSDLEKMVETSDEWIVQRTGIHQRHIAADDQPTSDLAIRAAKNALEAAGVGPADIDGVIVATTSADQTFPSVAIKVQKALGIPVCMAFDVQAVCSGFIYALSTANNMILCGQNKRILVIGAEKMSALLDWTDRTTCVLFGDGAGAVVLEAQDKDGKALTDKGLRGVCSTHLYANGALDNILYTDGGVSTTKTSGHIVMQGREVFRHAVGYMSDVVTKTLEANNITGAAIDWLIPHQANIRIIEGTARKLSMSMDKVVVTVGEHGNTSAASIPLALDQAVRDGRVKEGDLVLMEALGAGLTWGAALVRF